VPSLRVMVRLSCEKYFWRNSRGSLNTSGSEIDIIESVWKDVWIAGSRELGPGGIPKKGRW
jgi:hypothetical protein